MPSRLVALRWGRWRRVLPPRQGQPLPLERDHLVCPACGFGLSPLMDARCPACAQPFRGTHSHTTRRVADQPVGGCPVSIRFHVRRFRCRNPGCARSSFVEQYPALGVRSGRRSVPLQRQLEDIGLAGAADPARGSQRRG